MGGDVGDIKSEEREVYESVVACEKISISRVSAGDEAVVPSRVCCPLFHRHDLDCCHEEETHRVAVLDVIAVCHVHPFHMRGASYRRSKLSVIVGRRSRLREFFFGSRTIREDVRLYDRLRPFRIEHRLRLISHYVRKWWQSEARSRAERWPMGAKVYFVICGDAPGSFDKKTMLQGCRGIVMRSCLARVLSNLVSLLGLFRKLTRSKVDP